MGFSATSVGIGMGTGSLAGVLAHILHLTQNWGFQALFVFEAVALNLRSLIQRGVQHKGGLAETLALQAF